MENQGLMDAQRNPSGRRTALYRHFDADGRLLYVGISLSVVERLSQHSGKPWAQDITRVSAQWFESREVALEAERVAIHLENPLHNKSRPKPNAEVPSMPAQASRWVERAEHVAAHFNISLSVILNAIREGMPREQVGPKKYRYDLNACAAYFRAKSRAYIAEKAERKAQERIRQQEELVAKVTAAWNRALKKEGAPYDRS